MEANIRENTKKEKNMVKALMYGVMKVAIQEIGKTIRSMELESTNGVMVELIQESG